MLRNTNIQSVYLAPSKLYKTNRSNSARTSHWRHNQASGFTQNSGTAALVPQSSHLSFVISLACACAMDFVVYVSLHALPLTLRCCKVRWTGCRRNRSITPCHRCSSSMPVRKLAPHCLAEYHLWIYSASTYRLLVQR